VIPSPHGIHPLLGTNPEGLGQLPVVAVAVAVTAPFFGRAEVVLPEGINQPRLYMMPTVRLLRRHVRVTLVAAPLHPYPVAARCCWHARQ